MMGSMVVITKDRIIKTCENLWAEDFFLWFVFKRTLMWMSCYLMGLSNKWSVARGIIVLNVLV